MEFEAFTNKILLSSPTMHGDEIKYIEESLENDLLYAKGSNLEAIENMVCDKVGCKYAVSLSSGTSALHLAVKLAGVKSGDTVFCSDMTFAATVNPVFYENATPVFIDIEYDTWNMSPASLEKAFELYPDTKVIIVADLYGTPAKYDEITAIAKKHGAVIIEDAAESFGAKYKGKYAGTFGTYNAISFNINKIITGSAGGMLLTAGEVDANRARKWSNQSREDAPWYQHEELGYNYRMSGIVAGVVRAQLPYLEEHITRKKEVYERYKEGFKDLPVTMNPYDQNECEPNFWLSCMLIDKNAMCKQVRSDNNASYIQESGKTCPTEILETLAKYNVEGRPIWKPMHLQPLYRNHSFVTSSENMSEDVFERGLCLPSDIKMTAKEQNAIIELIKNCFD